MSKPRFYIHQYVKIHKCDDPCRGKVGEVLFPIPWKGEWSYLVKVDLQMCRYLESDLELS